MKGIIANEIFLFILHAQTIDNIKTSTSNLPRERISTPLPNLRDKLKHVTNHCVTFALRQYASVLQNVQRIITSLVFNNKASKQEFLFQN